MRRMSKDHLSNGFFFSCVIHLRIRSYLDVCLGQTQIQQLPSVTKCKFPKHHPPRISLMPLSVFFSSDIIKHNGKDRRKAIFIRYCGIWRIYMFYASYAYNRIHIPCVSNRNWLINRQSICQKPFRWCDVTSTIFDNKYYGKVQLRVHSDGTTILRLGQQLAFKDRSNKAKGNCQIRK